jgi:hypothetical protein
MKPFTSVIYPSIAAVFLALPAFAQDAFEGFDGSAKDRWEYIADGVMGGVSTGGAAFSGGAIQLTGEVSTKNNGGFIQAQRLLPDGLPEATQGFELDVRGNNETYYLFVRTKEMTRPWYFYNVSFNTSSEWQTVKISLEELVRSHAHLSEMINPNEVISIGLVAYGRDYQADLEVREIRLF